ncbi:hydroxyacylglutathione hydrolase [Pseudomonas sp. SIMBA_077]
MLQIDALPAFSDNYIWLLQDWTHKRCAVVDPGDATPVQEWLDQHPDWILSDILVTHHHFDHVGGVEQLHTLTGAKVWGPALENIPARAVALNDNDQINILGIEWRVLLVQGHTLGHIAYYHGGDSAPLLFCGDTLFAAGCGRLFEGTPEQMHHSLSRLATLPADTAVYCAHEYTQSNLRFAQAVEPNNQDIADRVVQVAAWRAKGKISLPSTIALELRTNPFLRVNETSVKEKADEWNKRDNKSPVAVFASLRNWKDNF